MTPSFITKHESRTCYRTSWNRIFFLPNLILPHYISSYFWASTRGNALQKLYHQFTLSTIVSLFYDEDEIIFLLSYEPIPWYKEPPPPLRSSRAVTWFCVWRRVDSAFISFFLQKPSHFHRRPLPTPPTFLQKGWRLLFVIIILGEHKEKEDFPGVSLSDRCNFVPVFLQFHSPPLFFRRGGPWCIVKSTLKGEEVGWGRKSTNFITFFQVSSFVTYFCPNFFVVICETNKAPWNIC